jgi:uncharacterized protein (DUF433 family)
MILDFWGNANVSRYDSVSTEMPMNLPDFLIRETTGEIRLRGHRIGLYHVVTYYNDGYSAEMLACQYPTLPLALIHNTIGFYLDNRAEVDAYVTDCHESLREQRTANPRRLPLAALRDRLATM